MAWYNGTFRCGHEGRVNVIGPHDQRDWKIDKAFSGLCPECYKIQRQKEIEEANNKAKEENEKLELPELTGTEKQVSWAITLRLKLIEEVNRIADLIDDRFLRTHNKHSKKAERYRETLDHILMTETEAKYFIDRRFSDVEDLMDKYKEEYNNNFDKSNNEIQKEEIEKENTVKPKEVKYQGIVKIDYDTTSNIVTVEYEKNETFIKIVKNKRFKWNEGKWQRKITEHSGKYQDRMAEIGNKLLSNGFIVTIMNDDAKDKAINGTYEKECFRWIQTDGKKLIIKWYDESQSVYNASRKLPTNKWSSELKATVVNLSHYKEVEEFAEMYGFKYYKDSKQLIEEYKNEINSISEVEVIKKEKEPIKDGLKDILNSSREVINDLKEG